MLHTYKCFKLSFKIKAKSAGTAGFWRLACWSNSETRTPPFYFIIKVERMNRLLVHITGVLSSLLIFAHDRQHWILREDLHRYSATSWVNSFPPLNAKLCLSCLLKNVTFRFLVTNKDQHDCQVTQEKGFLGSVGGIYSFGF